jgi:hypothetical protein
VLGPPFISVAGLATDAPGVAVPAPGTKEAVTGALAIGKSVHLRYAASLQGLPPGAQESLERGDEAWAEVTLTFPTSVGMLRMPIGRQHMRASQSRTGCP